MIVDTNSDVFFLNDSPSIKKTSLAGSATLGDTSQARFAFRIKTSWALPDSNLRIQDRA